MKVAILSDIHGNIDALEAVLKEIDHLKIDKILCLGDFVGYYYEPKKVFDALKVRNTIFIRGNHEDYLLSCIKPFPNHSILSELTHSYGSGLRFALEQFDQHSILEIEQMPKIQKVKINGSKILMCHGSPINTNDYVYPDATMDLLSICDIEDYDLVCLGHTHHPFVKRGKNTLIANVGSVGQSRVTGGIASWGLWNSENQVYIPRHTNYDATSLSQQVIKNDPENKYMYNILKRKIV